ncbi:hypothetical protein J4458_05940 [Candidatus Woesearchaeota archaeon]|nr:hypothetical protein [Candidatus Woesearchaeota archaeon]
MTDNGLEGELNKAREAFQNVKSAQVFGSGKGRTGSPTGQTFWDFVTRFSHRELEDMVAYLERNYRKMTPHELVDYHIRIVNYFARTHHLQVPSLESLRVDELRHFLTLYERQEQQRSLQSTLSREQNELQGLVNSRQRVDGFFQILHDHLYNDRGGFIEPKERDRLMDDTSIRMGAYRIYLKETGGKQLTDITETESSSAQLIPLHSPTRLSGWDLYSIKLPEKIAAYIAAGYFLAFFDGSIGDKRTAIDDTKARLGKVALNPSEASALRVFERNEDGTYSPSNYFALYTNAVWSQLSHFLTGLHQKGVKVVVNVNL